MRNKEEERETKQKLVRMNPDKEKFDVFVEIGKIYDIIDEIKEKRKNESIDNIKKRNREISDRIKKLLGLE